MRHAGPALLGFAALVVLSWRPVAAREDTHVDGPTPTTVLIDRYAPILVLKEQAHTCDTTGEPYVAAPVEVVFDDPAVRLRWDGPARTVVAEGPTAASIGGLGGDHYLDLPGNPLRPGCTYERHSRERMRDLAPTTMVHLAREEGRPGLVIQYWLFYYFNDWNNTHEGDWEMVQVVFDVDSVDEALRTDPVAVGFAQHAGGERASWDAPKFERQGTRPVVYVSHGSHASHFDHAVYLGWGEDGTGVGCDSTVGPSRSVPLRAQLFADETRVPPWAESWVTFDGRWGQRAPWEFNGPKGPSHNEQWSHPLTWQDGLRTASLAVPLSGALGPNPTDTFCRVTAHSADLLRLGVERRWLSTVTVMLVLAVLGVLLAASRRPLAVALRLYVGHFPTFLPAIGLVVAVGVGASLIRQVGGTIVGHRPMADYPAAASVFTFALGLTQQLVGLVVVAPATVYAAAEIRAGRRPRREAVMRAERAYLRRTTSALAQPLLTIALLGLLPFGVVPALYLAVRRMFLPQAVLLDGADPGEARALSAEAVSGRTLRTASVTAVLAALVLSPGPIVGVLLLVYTTRSISVVNLASGLVYAVLYPFVFVTTTLLYLDYRRAVTQ